MQSYYQRIRSLQNLTESAQVMQAIAFVEGGAISPPLPPLSRVLFDA